MITKGHHSRGGFQAPGVPTLTSNPQLCEEAVTSLFQVGIWDQRGELGCPKSHSYQNTAELGYKPTAHMSLPPAPLSLWGDGPAQQEQFIVLWAEGPPGWQQLQGWPHLRRFSPLGRGNIVPSGFPVRAFSNKITTPGCPLKRQANWAHLYGKVFPGAKHFLGIKVKSIRNSRSC